MARYSWRAQNQSGELDLTYLNKWAGELNVGDLLERALLETL